MILITGSTGLVGSYLLCFLVNDNLPIRALKRSGSSYEQLKIAFENSNFTREISFSQFIDKVEWVDGDLTNFSEIEGLLDGVDEVFHVAAMVSFHRRDRKNIDVVNVDATGNLVNACLRKGINKFHFVSSIASLNRNENDVISEKNDVSDKKFSTAYSKSKFLAEMEVWRGFDEGLQGVIVNPGIILGPAIESHEAIRAFKFIKKGFGFYPRGKNGYVDVRDVARIFYQLSQNQSLFGERYLLVAESVSYIDLFTWMSEAFKIKPPRFKANIYLSYMIAFFESLRSMLTGGRPVLSPDLVKLVNSNYSFDNSKIIKAIDTEFIPIKQSVMDTCNYMLKREKQA